MMNAAPALAYLHLTELSVTLFAWAFSLNISTVYLIQSDESACSENCICSCKWHTCPCTHTHTHTLAHSSTRWFSTLASVWLCLRKPRNVSSGFLISDHSIGPCEAYSTVFSRQSSLEIDIHCVYCPDRTLLPLECHFLGHWTLADFGLQRTIKPTWSVLALLPSSKHFLCLLWSVCCSFAFLASVKLPASLSACCCLAQLTMLPSVSSSLICWPHPPSQTGSHCVRRPLVWPCRSRAPTWVSQCQGTACATN